MDTQIVSGGITGVVVMVIYTIYKIVKKSSCSSKCCGAESSFKMSLSSPLRQNSGTQTEDLNVV